MLPRSYCWLLVPVLGLAMCSAVHAEGQAETPAPSPFSPLNDGEYFRDHRDRGMSESARRFGREHQGAIILGIEPVLIHGRTLNRIKSLDEHGRVLIWIDDPQVPRSSRRSVDDAGDGW